MGRSKRLKPKTNGSGTAVHKIHTNMQYDSDREMTKLADALEPRFLELCNAYLRIKGEEIEVPSYLDADMLLWRRLIKRFREGKFQNTEDEKLAMRRIADWTYKANCELRNQKYIPIVWVD